jgi:hypothetical protein
MTHGEKSARQTNERTKLAGMFHHSRYSVYPDNDSAVPCQGKFYRRRLPKVWRYRLETVFFNIPLWKKR